jgi:hypothetical protein
MKHGIPYISKPLERLDVYNGQKRMPRTSTIPKQAYIHRVRRVNEFNAGLSKKYGGT